MSSRIGLLSGIGGFLVGLILTRSVGGAGAGGFFKGLGISAGGMLGLAALVGLVAWLLADIPPTINGHRLNMVVEIRLPKGAPAPTPGGPALKDLQFISSSPFTHTYRASEVGTTQVSEAKQVDGRWIVPGFVWIFTTRGERSIAISTSEKEAIGFEAEFPSHPSAKYEQWSEWLPRIIAGKPWPDTQNILPIPHRGNHPSSTAARPAVVAESEFAALTPDAPLDKWLGYLKYGMASDREQAIMKVVEARPADLVMLLRSTKSGEYDQAIYAVRLLKVIDPAVLQAMRDDAARIEDQIRRFNTMKPDQPGYYELGNDIRNQFKAWSQAWWNVHKVSGVDGRPPLKEIVKLAKVQPESVHMQEVVLDGEAHLGGLTPAAK